MPDKRVKCPICCQHPRGSPKCISLSRCCIWTWQWDPLWWATCLQSSDPWKGFWSHRTQAHCRQHSQAAPEPHNCWLHWVQGWWGHYQKLGFYELLTVQVRKLAEACIVCAEASGLPCRHCVVRESPSEAVKKIATLQLTFSYKFLAWVSPFLFLLTTR